jgi:signal transduction histidine kinase
MAEEPDNLTLRLLRDIRERMTTMATKDDLAGLATKADLADVERKIRADVASDLVLTRKELSEQIVGLRRAVVEYHSTTVGHGILISELEARLRRVEQHIGLSPLASH